MAIYLLELSFELGHNLVLREGQPMKSGDKRLNTIGSFFVCIIVLTMSGCQALPRQTTPSSVTLSQSPLDFGTITVGSTKTMPEVVSNQTGFGITINQVSTSGAAFQVSGSSFPVTLNPGQSATLLVTFTPQSSGAQSGKVAFSSQPASGSSTAGSGKGTVTTLSLSGNASSSIPSTSGQLTANPSSLAFGNVSVGASATVFDSITNSGTSGVTVSQVTASGSGFSVSGISLPLTLSAGQSYTFNVVFTPQAGGTASGTISVASNATNPKTAITLSGSGVASGQLLISPSAANFGNVAVGTSQNYGATLSASSGPVTISSANTSNSEFSISGISLPKSLNAGQSVPMTVVFSPQVAGAASANVAFVTNAANAPSMSLTGSGTVTAQHSVALTWNASTSNGINGYNVYRGTQTGGPYGKINSALDPSTALTDLNVVSGQSYYYVVTAVDSSGAESGYSNEVAALIP